MNRLLPCLLILAPGASLAAQPVPLPPAPKPAAAAKPVEIHGDAKVSVHPYQMEEGRAYRITARAEGFLPRVRVRAPNRQPFGGAAGFPYSDPLDGPPDNFAADRHTARLLYVAPATGEYQITVEAAAGSELPAGPLPYTLTIERGALQPRLTLADRPLAINENSRKLVQGKAYAITVTGGGFAPEVQILDGSRRVATAFNGRWFGFGADAEFVTSMTFRPARTTDYRIVVGVGPVEEKRRTPLTYQTQVVELKVALDVTGQLTRQDPPYPRRGGPHKVYPVKLEAGKNYQIDMVSRVLDAYLFVEDAGGTVLAQDDDSGGGLNARIVFQPPRTATYRIVATTFNRPEAQPIIGPYSLQVLENAPALPRFGGPPPFGNFSTYPQN
jgi:hypothetical protein